MPAVPMADLHTMLMADVGVHQKIMRPNQHREETIDEDSLPTLNDLLIVLVPLLTVFAGIGVGLNFAMIQE